MAIKKYIASKSIDINFGGIQGGASLPGGTGGGDLGNSLGSLSRKLLAVKKEKELNKLAGQLTTSVKENITNPDMANNFNANYVQFSQAYLDGSLKEKVTEYLPEFAEDLNQYDDKDIMKVLGSYNQIGSQYISEYANNQADYYTKYDNHFNDYRDGIENLADYYQDIKAVQDANNTKFGKMFPSLYIAQEKSKFNIMNGAERGAYVQAKIHELGGAENAADFFKELEMPAADTFGLSITNLDDRAFYYSAMDLDIDTIFGEDKLFKGIGKTQFSESAESRLDKFINVLSGYDRNTYESIAGPLTTQVQKLALQISIKTGVNPHDGLDKAIEIMEGKKVAVDSSLFSAGVTAIVDEEFVDKSGYTLSSDRIIDNVDHIRTERDMFNGFLEYILSQGDIATMTEASIDPNMNFTDKELADIRRENKEETLNILRSSMVLMNTQDMRHGLALFVKHPVYGMQRVPYEGSGEQIVIPWHEINSEKYSGLFMEREPGAITYVDRKTGRIKGGNIETWINK